MENLIKSPFKFLDSYSIEDKDIFFGREEESKEIYKKFFSSNLLVLYGKSGTGKSSLINCGLMANIPSEDALLIEVRCSDDPLNNLITVLQDFATIKSRDVIKLLDNIFDDYFKPMAFVFDQFEEIFIVASEQKRKAFIQALNKILKHKEVKKNIILVIREEYLASLTDIESDIPTLFNNRIRLQGISKDKYKSIIEKPCRRKNVKIEMGLTNLIIDRINNEVGQIELTYFQILMDNLYKKAIDKSHEKPELKIADFKEMGSIANILGDFLNYELTKMDDMPRVEAILKALVTHEGTKKQISLENISKITSIPTNKVKNILHQLINKRILRDKNELGLYELFHDSLAKRIFDRMSEEEKKASEIKQLIVTRYNQFKESRVYLDKETLQYIQPYLKYIVLSKSVILFIKKSEDKVNDKGNSLLFYILIGLIIPAIIGMYFLINSIKDKNNEISSLNNQVSRYITINQNAALDKINSEFVRVKGGYFYFGVQPNEENQDSSLYVKVSSFEIDKYEVTVKKYRLFCEMTSHKMPDAPPWGWSDDEPIVNVNWNDANDYCSWLTQETGVKHRLPTEAEFEFASKGGTKSLNMPYSGGWSWENCAIGNRTRTTIVGSMKPNELGIYDMSGNVREWCYDWYSEDYKGVINSKIDPTGPESPSDERNLKSVRGGAYSSGSESLKVTARYYGRVDAVKDEDGNGLEHFGFRCVREL